MFLIAQDQVPRYRLKDISYGRIIVDYRPQKEEPNRTRLTVGVNLFFYAGYVSTTTVDITTEKLIINSTIYTPGARYTCCDIKSFYLGTPFIRYEYIKIYIDIIPEEIIMEYNLINIAHNGYIYCEIWKGMYCLPKAGILANHQLVRRLEPKGYSPCKHTPGLWRHKWVPIKFSLVVDDFRIKNVGKQHVDHLINSIQDNYQV